MKRLLPCSLLLILVWSACHPDLDGTTGPMPATTETSYQTASYLSNQKVTSICEDAEGHIWIGTLRGLNRFDAHEYHQYLCNDHDSTSLPDNQIQHMLRDSKGNLWITTVHGACRYTDQDRFERIDIPGLNKNGVQLLETADGHILLNQHERLLQYSPETNSFQCLLPNFDPQNYRHGQCYIDAEGSLWDVKPTYARRINLQDLQCADSLALPTEAFCSTQDAQGTIWIGGKGIIALLDTRTRHLCPLPDVLAHHPRLSKAQVSLLHPYSPTQLLIVTDEDGLFCYNHMEQTVTHQDEEGFPFEAPHFCINRLFTDSNQNLWMGSVDQGYTVRYRYKERFNSDRYLSSQLKGISVTGMTAAPDGTLWMTTMMDGVYRYDPSTRFIQHIEGLPKGSKGFTRIYADSRGQIWYGTEQGQLICCQWQKGEIHVKRTYSLPYIMHLTESTDSTLLVSTAGTDLYVLPSDQEEFTTVRLFHTSFTFIASLMPMEDGSVLVAAFAQPILRFHPQTLTSEELPVHPEEWQQAIHRSKFIPSCLRTDSRGRIWIGTIANGLLCYDPATGHLQTQPGTPCTDISSIEEDQLGHLWVSTMYGLGCLDPTIGSLTNYYAADGLGGNQFYDRSSCRLPDGTLVFGGTHGLTFFNPLETLPARSIPLYIEELKVLGETARPADSGLSPINRRLSLRPDIHLNHHHSSLSLSFAALDYSEHPRMRYQYRMEGFDRTWIDAGSVHEAFYANLPAGKYTFRVKATSDGRGDTTGTETSLRVIVHPAPWLTWWAKCLYLLLAGGIVGTFLRALHRIREGREAARRAVLEKEQEKRVNRMNMSFFANVSHEFRTPLTMIAGPVEQLSHDPSLSDSQRHLLNTVKRSVVRMLRLVNQLMDFNKLENDTLRLAVGTADIVAELRHQVDIFSVNAREKGITLTAFGLEESLSLPLDTDKLDKIITNLLSNALKFTSTGGQIELHLDLIPAAEAQQLYPEAQAVTDSYVKVVVADTGRGIPPEQMERIFKRYYQVESADGRGIYNWGTGIGLYYARALARLHHGYLWAANRTDVASGAQFTLLLPASEKAYRPEEFLPDTTSQNALYPLHPSASPIPAPAADSNQQSVLVVDDDSEVTRYLEALLSPHFRIICRFDADSAFRAMQEEAPDLVLSDVVMPGKTGYELCKEIKGDMQLCHIPVILLTAKATDENKIEGLETGADAYVTKPFNPTYLLALIRSQLTNRQRLKQILNTATHTDALEAEDLMPQDKAFMDELYALMESELSNSELDVSIMTERMHISRTKFYYKVKGLTGENPATFFRTYKLNRAAQLLQEGEHTISEVADLCGFSTLSHFSASFKRKFGISPSEYVRGKQERRNE